MAQSQHHPHPCACTLPASATAAALPQQRKHLTHWLLEGGAMYPHLACAQHASPVLCPKVFRFPGMELLSGIVSWPHQKWTDHFPGE